MQHYCECILKQLSFSSREGVVNKVTTGKESRSHPATCIHLNVYLGRTEKELQSRVNCTQQIISKLMKSLSWYLILLP